VKIAAREIDLCLREPFVFRDVQTDPKWFNVSERENALGGFTFS
jgi:hypothetical protein